MHKDWRKTLDWWPFTVLTPSSRGMADRTHTHTHTHTHRVRLFTFSFRGQDVLDMVLKMQQKEGSKNRGEKRRFQVVSMKDPQLGKEENKGQRSCTPSGSPHNMSQWSKRVFFVRTHRVEGKLLTILASCRLETFNSLLVKFILYLSFRMVYKWLQPHLPYQM